MLRTRTSPSSWSPSLRREGAQGAAMISSFKGISGSWTVPPKESLEEDRPLNNPASLIGRPASYVPYPKEAFKDKSMVFLSLQIKPKTMSRQEVEMVFCLASIIQTQIRDDNNSNRTFAPCQEWDIPFPSLPSEAGGDFVPTSKIPLSVLAREDYETRQYILQGTVPMFYTVFRFITHLWQNIKYDQECNILALVYINRITLARNIALTTRNWRMVWLVAIMIAQKVWSNKPLGTRAFSKIFSDLQKSVVRKAESKMMEMMEHYTGVEPSLYAKYYLELNYAFKEMMNSINVADRTEMWDWEPISKFTKIVLERKFKQSGSKHQER